MVSRFIECYPVLIKGCAQIRIPDSPGLDYIDEMNREEPTKRSTVQTFLRTLVKKGLVDYEVDDRTFIYYPIVEEKDVAHHAFQHFVEHVFEGSMEGFVSFFVRNNYVPPEKIEKIHRMLDKKDD